MSVENLDGNGFADQPSIIYSFEKDDSDEVQIRELARSGFGQAGHSPGDVIERETTKSDPTDSLPELELPGDGGLAQDDCGEDIPAFACAGDEGCGKPVYVGRTCANPTCERDWPAAVKRKVVTSAGKLEGLRRALYARHNGKKDIDFNHVVASPPDGFAVDSENPLKRTLLIMKTLLEKKWHIDGFVAIYHPYRIKKEYRKDQYEHGGAEGEGDLTWKDILNQDNPSEYLYFSPHFHLFFPAVRKSFDYSVAEAVEDETGWLFHRITKDGEDDNRSVKNLDDLVHQLTYCYSHAGVRVVGPRDELASRMKGDLHNCYIPDGVEDETLAMFCDAAPTLLGVQFANLNNATCDAEISNQGAIDETSHSPTTEAACSQDTGQDCDCTERDHPLDDVWNPGSGSPAGAGRGGNPWTSNTFDAGAGSGDSTGDDWTGGSSSASSSSSTQPDSAASNAAENTDGETDEPESESPVVDNPEPCGGSLRPMHEAQTRLEDEEWCQQAEYVSGLRSAVEEWLSITGGDEDHPWVEEPPDDTEEGTYPEVVHDD